MNSERTKELLKLRIQRWFADTAGGKVCNFAFLTSSGGNF